MKCEKCGSEMELYADGGSVGSMCPACGWSVLTTRSVHPILEDTTVYRVFLGAGAPADTDAIRSVAKAAGVGYPKAKAMIEEGGGLVLEGCAVEIRKKLWGLEEVAEVHVEPPFPYRPDEPGMERVR